nr:uncharacterized protein LOC112582058 [Bubalus bubalis]
MEETVLKAQGVAAACAGLSLAGAARANGQRLAARPAPEPPSRPFASWRRHGRRAGASARKSRRRHSRRQGMRTAVGSVKMQPPWESRVPALVAAVAAADGALCRSPSARESGGEQLPVPPRPRLRDLPALLRSGLTLRRKHGAAAGREKLHWVRTGRPASRTLSFRPVQIYGHRGLAAPTGHGNSVISLRLPVQRTLLCLPHLTPVHPPVLGTN